MKKWDLPNGWEWKNLKHISTICAGNSAPQDKKYFVNGKYNFVRTSDLGLFGINSNLKESRDKINDLAIKELKFKVIPEGSDAKLRMPIF